MSERLQALIGSNDRLSNLVNLLISREIRTGA